MFRLAFNVSNEEAIALRHELQKFKQYCLKAMVGERSDNRDTATPAYTVVNRVLGQLDAGLDRAGIPRNDDHR